MDKPLTILFKFPSRGRRARFFKSLDTIYNNLFDKENFHVSATLDLDDLEMCDEEVVNKITNEYKNMSIGWGYSISKVHAVNRNMPRNIEWDIVVCMSDDMEFTTLHFDEMIRIEMNKNFPDLDGLLHFPDKDEKHLATMYIAGFNFYDRFGYIYNPAFKSLFCDNLVQDEAKKLGKYKFVDFPIYVHLCPRYGHLPKDELWNNCEKDWQHDEKVYHQIKNG